jgi:hypothetical protein
LLTGPQGYGSTVSVVGIEAETDPVPIQLSSSTQSVLRKKERHSSTGGRGDSPRNSKKKSRDSRDSRDGSGPNLDPIADSCSICHTYFEVSDQHLRHCAYCGHRICRLPTCSKSVKSAALAWAKVPVSQHLLLISFSL